MRILIQLRSSPAATAAAAAFKPEPTLTSGIASSITGLAMDYEFPPIQVPSARPVTGGHLASLAQPLTFSMDSGASTFLVRGSMPDSAIAPTYSALISHPDVVGVYADPVIATTLTCGGDPAVGTDADVARLLDVPSLQAAGMDGSNVCIAVVDTGINLSYLQGKGRQPNVDVANSFTPSGVATTPGQHPVAHGTMCAFDIGIAAPSAQFLDDAVLLSQTPGANVMQGLLSDAVLAYSKLLQMIGGMAASKRALVVSNSWGMFSPSWDFPPGHPGNYSDNPNHPFNIIVASLESAGADILFAAGNCGRDCPDGRCDFGASLPICGANSHPRVITVAGVDTNKDRVGYSSQGPGRLTFRKPDIASYTHFTGSGVFPVDSGTSAACPVAAGVIAAVRSKVSSTTLSPANLRSLLFKTAEDRGGVGFDNDYGWGILDPAALLTALRSAGLVAQAAPAAPVVAPAPAETAVAAVGAEVAIVAGRRYWLVEIATADGQSAPTDR
jgi:subtilisin family serine protease